MYKTLHKDISQWFHHNYQRDHHTLLKTSATKQMNFSFLSPIKAPENIIYSSDSFSSSHLIHSALEHSSSKDSTVPTVQKKMISTGMKSGKNLMDIKIK